MTRNSRDAVIVRCTVDLGRNLDLRVVAEGWKTSAPGWNCARSAVPCGQPRSAEPGPRPAGVPAVPLRAMIQLNDLHSLA
jgi:hypothetical protein